MKDKGFKLIAIKPLKGCNSEFLKVLRENTIYYFYNNYKIHEKDDRITFEEILPPDFYRINNIDVSISAIVGKNGSGKSTITELLFWIINNIAQKQDEVKAELKHVPGLKLDLFYHTDEFYKIRINNTNIQFYKYNIEGLPIQVGPDEFKLRDFFYTIVINYSHYAYNTNDYDRKLNWLDGLFHKNDGYQTPLVINPMRKGGIIDINNENHLVKSRLIANLLRPSFDKSFSFRNLTEKLQATSLKLTLNKTKRYKVLYEITDQKGKRIEEVKITNLNFDPDELYQEIGQLYNFKISEKDKKEYKIAYDYLLYKAVSIAIKYEDYQEFFSKEEKKFYEGKLTKFIYVLKSDYSHVTFKFRQILNFLRLKHIDLEDQIIHLDDLSKTIQEKCRQKSIKKKFDIIDFVPPPIFNTDIILNPRTEYPDKIIENNGIEFKKLSSGEKQMVYSVSSLLYHLNNLNSVKGSKTKIAYKYINIVLEEIELYFHPEMQRTYIKYILDSISKIEIPKIKGINICFVTHSPFILSDIPDSNILFLGNYGIPLDNKQTIKTFGGNIHDLLSDVFFLGNGFIGEFAKQKIDKVIKALNSDLSIGIERHEIFKTINLIGEPFLKEKLLEKYYMKFEREKRVAELEAELERYKAND